MTLIWLTVNGEYAQQLNSDLITAGYSITEIASTGDFLHYGSTIFLLCVETEKVKELIAYVKTKMQAYRHMENEEGSQSDFTLYSIPLNKFKKIKGQPFSQTKTENQTSQKTT